MSFDVLVFEKTKAPNFYDDFLKWSAEQTEWAEDRDYNSIDGTSAQLAAWFMEMKESFPPLNGPYYLGDEKSFANRETENRLTDYSIGSHIIYASFGWSTAREAAETAERLARKHGVGFFNPQTGDVICDGLIMCEMRTESNNDEKIVPWERIEREILSLDSPERDCAFIVINFVHHKNDTTTDTAFMQCMPDYPKWDGFFKRLFSSGKKPNTASISSYTVEAGNGQKIYFTTVSQKNQIIEIFREFYFSQQMPDFSNWHDTGIL